MRITEVTAIPLSIAVEVDDYRARIGGHSTVSIIVVEVTTNNGLRGYGEGLARHAPKAQSELIDHVLARHYIGQNPFEAERLLGIEMRSLKGRTGGLLKIGRAHV